MAPTSTPLVEDTIESIDMTTIRPIIAVTIKDDESVRPEMAAEDPSHPVQQRPTFKMLSIMTALFVSGSI